MKNCGSCEHWHTDAVLNDPGYPWGRCQAIQENTRIRFWDDGEDAVAHGRIETLAIFSCILHRERIETIDALYTPRLLQGRRLPPAAGKDKDSH